MAAPAVDGDAWSADGDGRRRFDARRCGAGGRASAGDREAFDVIVERHRRTVYQVCYRFVNNHEDASDSRRKRSCARGAA